MMLSFFEDALFRLNKFSSVSSMESVFVMKVF